MSCNSSEMSKVSMDFSMCEVNFILGVMLQVDVYRHGVDVLVLLNEEWFGYLLASSEVGGFVHV